MRVAARALRLAAVVICCGLGGAASAAAANPAYPQRPIRIVVPFTAGSGPDVVARMVGQNLTEAWGQPVVVDNRAGAGGTLGADVVAKAAPDGYTLLMATPSQTISMSLYPSLPYNFGRDFAPVTVVAGSDYAMAVGNQVPAKSLRELVALAKARPGQLNFGSAGNGTVAHVAGEQLKQQAGIDIVHVPYKGAAQVITDVIGGQISMMFNSVATLAPQIKAGKLRAMAVAAPNRNALLPEVPTFTEAGVPGIEIKVWFGLLTTAGTPADIVSKLNAEVVRIVRTPDIQERIVGQGMDVVGNTPPQFAALIKQEITKYAGLVKPVARPE
ncbi:MAG: tripartite tricarboxylate transporter substrate binding protein [Betaproteobacteria bacterium]|nr:tripartite tricarboxylate transporter substrate binding protein [Betaproteobacteria bacterium]